MDSTTAETKEDSRFTEEKTLLVRKEPIEDRKKDLCSGIGSRSGMRTEDNFLTSIKSKKPTAFADFELPPFPLGELLSHKN